MSELCFDCYSRRRLLSIARDAPIHHSPVRTYEYEVYLLLVRSRSFEGLCASVQTVTGRRRQTPEGLSRPKHRVSCQENSKARPFLPCLGNTPAKKGQDRPEHEDHSRSLERAVQTIHRLAPCAAVFRGLASWASGWGIKCLSEGCNFFTLLQ